eukprot:11178431-Lingulodinium_polyedra.AAC.1
MLEHVWGRPRPRPRTCFMSLNNLGTNSSMGSHGACAPRARANKTVLGKPQKTCIAACLSRESLGPVDAAQGP